MLATQSVLYAVAGALNKVLALVTVPILTRTLSPSGYGLAELATGLAALLTAVALFGADIPAARLASAVREKQDKARVYSSYVGAITGLGILAGLSVWFLAPKVADALWSSPGAADLARLVALLIPVATFRGALITVQRIEGRAVVFAALASIDLVAKLAFAVSLVLLGQGPEGVVRGFLLGNVVGLAAAALVTMPLLLKWPHLNETRELLRGGLAFLPSGVTFILVDYALRFFVANDLGVAAVGQLAAAMRIASVMGLSTAAFSLAWGPYAIVRTADRETRNLFGSVLTAFGGVAVFAAIAIGLVGNEIITFVSGSQFAPGSQALPGLILGVALSGPVFIVLVATGVGGRTAWAAMAVLIGAATQLGLGVLLIRPMGLQGIGIAAASGQIATLAVAGVASRDVIRARWGLLACGLGGAVLLTIAAGILSGPTNANQLVRLAILAALASGLGFSLPWLLRVARSLAAGRTPMEPPLDYGASQIYRPDDEA